MVEHFLSRLVIPTVAVFRYHAGNRETNRETDRQTPLKPEPQ